MVLFEYNYNSNNVLDHYYSFKDTIHIETV